MHTYYSCQFAPSVRAVMTSSEQSPLLDTPVPEIQNFEEPRIATDVADVSRSKKSYTVEPAVLLLVIGLNLSGTIVKNQIIYQTCTSVFLYNASLCGSLGTSDSTTESKKIETEVQPYAAKIFLAKIIIESIVPAICGLYFGSWSDRNGRKPLLVAAYLGFSSLYIITSVICFISTKFVISPWFYVLSVIPMAISGGNCTYRIAIFCYIADTTTVEERPIRMAFLEALIYIGLMTGSLASSYVYAATSALWVFIISATIIVCSSVYIIIWVPESLSRQREIRSEEARNTLNEMLKTCFKQRENHKRLIIWSIISINFISVFILDGNLAVFYLFMREKFQWTIRDFSIYEALAALVPVVGNVIGMPLMRKKLDISVTLLALMGLGSCTLNALVKGLASVAWHIYFAVGLGIFKAIEGPMCRVIISNVVSVTELGKIFSLITILESIAPFGGATLYTFVYSETLDTNPGLFSFLSTGLYLICFILMLVIFGIKHSKPGHYGSTL